MVQTPQPSPERKKTPRSCPPLVQKKKRARKKNNVVNTSTRRTLQMPSRSSSPVPPVPATQVSNGEHDVQTANPKHNQILYLQTFLTSLIANKGVYNEIKEGVNKVLKDALEHKEALDIKLEAYDQVIKDIEERLSDLSDQSDLSAL